MVRKIVDILLPNTRCLRKLRQPGFGDMTTPAVRRMPGVFDRTVIHPLDHLIFFQRALLQYETRNT